MESCNPSNELAMRAKDLGTLLEYAFSNNRQVLITGAPGIGKTDIVMQSVNK